MSLVKTIDSFSGEYSFLSNFYPAKLVVFDLEFKTSEHAYQAFKTLDFKEFNQIKNAQTPGNAKKLGKYVTLRDDWDDIKLKVMKVVVRAKFDQNPEIRVKLINTAPAELIEGNAWRDDFWGVYNGVGENHLGKILMNLRNSYA